LGSETEGVIYMNLLKSLITEKSDDLSRLPKDVMTSIKRNIRKGAEDLQLKWANALELVHKAYQIEGVERPDPTMDTAWSQYEENLQFAVQQLASNRGMDGDWRMSSSMFREALERKTPYKITLSGKGIQESYTLEADNIGSVIKSITEASEYDVITTSTANQVTLKFAKWGVHRNLKVTVSK